MPEYQQVDIHGIVQEAVNNSSQVKERQNDKMIVWGSHTKSQERGKAKGKVEKERYIHLNAEFQRKQGEIRKPSSVINAKK